jgi:hypothetical protein
MSLADVLHTLADAIHRPADHPAAELHAAIDGLDGAPDNCAPAAPAPPADPMPGPDAPAVFGDAPAPFGTETAPEPPASA